MQEEVQDLLKKYLSGNCSEEQRALLESWYLKYEQAERPEVSAEAKEKQLDEVWQFLNDQHLSPHQPTRHILWRILATAAVLLIVLGIGFYRYKTTSQISKAKLLVKTKSILPGQNKAVLTLSDGRSIVLDETTDGRIADQSGVTITKTRQGEIVYAVNNHQTSQAINKVSTPKGGQYQIQLPDGTKVWLNCASSLRYPASFSGSERKVELSGEAYFEVTKNKNMPFKVLTKKQEVSVLGTHFNINAYEEEESIKTTLLEGSVKVNVAESKSSALLKPGQQSVYEKNGLNVVNADLDEVIAWKNGYFLFQDEDIRSIMRKVARWYDIEVVYQGNLSQKHIGGSVSKSKNLNDVLMILKETDEFNFKIEGRRVTVMP
ncbi:anti-sigma factor [Pedobacter sp. HMWF019]|uniref:FecR family protein n=1 Tax=Pedobacter sp. HMWF019 TaxID=2056856 RepID=UPI000D394599|nr:FecR family protein [Pedobacter sp. HMWF019]PTS95275.1 anti-sigma factor [Pedobacter sp. HMWF019]